MKSGGGNYTLKELRCETLKRELSRASGVYPIEMISVGDSELVARMQRGDRAAFATLVDRHKHSPGQLNDPRQSRGLIFVSPSKGQVHEPPEGG